MFGKYFLDFIANDIIIVALISVFVSQFLKTIFMLIIEHKIYPERILADGGMPSSHSTVVTSVAFTIGLTYGFDSPLFGIAAVFAYIVMHDAKGVRLETGKQAKILNDMIDLFARMGRDDISPEKKLKEFVGHTPIQVLGGFILGIIVASIYFALNGVILC